MSKRLSKNLSSRYLEAAQRMRPQKARQKITAFVESYDDVFFGVPCCMNWKRKIFILK